MSKARQKGTSFEVSLLPKLKLVWPKAERAPLKGNNDYGDFINVDEWLIEARNRKTWALPAWIRGVYGKLHKRHGDTSRRWMIVFKGDKRTELYEDYVLLPFDLLIDLLYVDRYHLHRDNA